MALTSPGVEVSIIDQSQYLPAPTNSVPLVVLATAQNKADPNGIGVAAATTAANANKLFQVTSQRDLVTLYGNPFFYTTTNGTPIQGYELNEYGLLAAYSLLGVTNRCYVLRADIDLASLVGQTGRPTGNPDNGTYWLNTSTTTWGIFEFDATTGQFTEQLPIVITDSIDVAGGAPLPSIGSIGDYAVIAIEPSSILAPTSTNSKQYFYKTVNNTWVVLGSGNWMGDWPTIQGTASNPTLTAGTFSINVDGDFSTTLTIAPGDLVADVASDINALGFAYLSASVRDGKLCIFSKQTGGDVNPNKFLTISTATPAVLTALGITAGTYYQPELTFGTSAQMPLWQSSQTYPKPTGSVWIKVGAAGGGLLPVVAEFNGSTSSWVNKAVSLATSDWAATTALDASGGKAIPAGTVYAMYNYNGQYNQGPIYLYERVATGPTVVTGNNTSPSFTNGPYTFSVYISTPNSASLSSAYTVSLADNTDATDFVTAWSAANIPYTIASVTTDGAIQLVHTEGGEIIIDDTITTAGATYGTSSGLTFEAGFSVTVDGVKFGPSASVQFTPGPQTSTSGVGSGLVPTVVASYQSYSVRPTAISSGGSGYAVGDTVTFSGANLGGATPANDLVVEVTLVNGSGAVQALTYVSGTSVTPYQVQLSNWVYFAYDANEGEPVAEPTEGTNWFYSVVDQVDILMNTSAGWVGYKNTNYDLNGFPTTGVNATDPAGPIISASEPTTQSDGTALVYGDLWISTADLEQYPIISRWQSVDGVNKWVLIDNTDQTNSNGIVFADARWATNGTTSVTDDPIPTIVSLLTSNYLDVDAPEPSLYPVGMLLWNSRRSGYNVKQFRSNYFNSTNFPGVALPTETNAWVTVSGNQSNGSPYMGRKAQRAVVVQSLRSAIDTNTDIRDEDNFFNLMATPNYPELQPNMVVLNSDRGETGYILGDTPMGLSDSATEIQAWATNAAGATSTGEEGCVTRNTYLGLFYPSGLASDLSGNLVAVPASHMMLRTFLRNDTISYPWLAAAGTRRGIIDNAANIGYLNRTTGEFQVIKTRIGVRDVLYVNFINPLVFFTGNGLLNYGNKTSFNSQSALDRTNVARLVAYIRRQLTLAARPFVFEPNDPLTRQQISGVVESLMIDLVAKRGLFDYLVVCDESNNTPARIDRNELWIDVAVEPVKAAEFIYIPVRILNTGELSGA
jgi:hypothetical protein